jgi:hypothetical protein
MLAFGLCMGVLAIILNAIGVTLGFVYLFMGIAIGGAVAPIYCCVNWDKASAAGAIAGSIAGTRCQTQPPHGMSHSFTLGTVSGIITWITTARVLGGTINVATLQGSGALNNFPMLFGNIASLTVSAVVCVVISLRKPQNYDWDTTQVPWCHMCQIEAPTALQMLELNVESCAEVVLPSKGGAGPATVVTVHFNSSHNSRLRRLSTQIQRCSPHGSDLLSPYDVSGLLYSRVKILPKCCRKNRGES